MFNTELLSVVSWGEGGDGGDAERWQEEKYINSQLCHYQRKLQTLHFTLSPSPLV